MRGRLKILASAVQSRPCHHILQPATWLWRRRSPGKGRSITRYVRLNAKATSATRPGPKHQGRRRAVTASFALGFRSSRAASQGRESSMRRGSLAATVSAVCGGNITDPPQRDTERAPAGHILLRVFVGGALDEGILKEDDERMVAIVRAELRELLGVTAAALVTRDHRYSASMAQYHVGEPRDRGGDRETSRWLPGRSPAD